MTPVEQIELKLLNLMCIGYDEISYSFVYFEKETGMDREQVRGHIRSLRNRGYAKQEPWVNDDLIPAGSGYGLTAKGKEYLQKLKEKQQ